MLFLRFFCDCRNRPQVCCFVLLTNVKIILQQKLSEKEKLQQWSWSGESENRSGWTNPWNLCLLQFQQRDFLQCSGLCPRCAQKCELNWHLILHLQNWNSCQSQALIMCAPFNYNHCRISTEQSWRKLWDPVNLHCSPQDDLSLWQVEPGSS